VDNHADAITPSALRDWPLPSAGDSKYSRGQVVVVGGAAASPGAAILAGLAALRVGAGRLTLAVDDAVAGAVGVAVPESGVIGLGNTAALSGAVERADAVVVGPGLDDIDQAVDLLGLVRAALPTRAAAVLDAYALAALPRLSDGFASRLVLTPNGTEAEQLLDRSIDGVSAADVVEIADRHSCVVTCSGWIAAPGARSWRDSTGHPGLGTSGSGDVLAGAVGGLLARGASAEQAACWGTYLHSAAGDRLAAGVGHLGFLARELVDMLPRLLVEIGDKV
jgi:ADP-dependent NAD(P)H-hydrate dehydratase